MMPAMKFFGKALTGIPFPLSFKTTVVQGIQKTGAFSRRAYSSDAQNAVFQQHIKEVLADKNNWSNPVPAGTKFYIPGRYLDSKTFMPACTVPNIVAGIALTDDHTQVVSEMLKAEDHTELTIFEGMTKIADKYVAFESAFKGLPYSGFFLPLSNLILTRMFNGAAPRISKPLS